MARNSFVRVDYDARGFTANYSDGTSQRIDTADFPAEIQDRATALGLKNSIIDAAAGSESLASFKTAIQARVETLLGGEWAKRERAGISTEMLVEAIMAAAKESKQVLDRAKVQAKVADWDTKTKTAFVKKQPAVAVALAKIIAERNGGDNAQGLEDMFD